jgi:superfamily II DNA/RNA helicase
VQRSAFAAVLSGGDAVLLSETGSGKTLAYALPILHRLLDRGARIEEAAEIEEAKDEAAVERPRRLRGQADQVLVLVPNRDLCAQVLSVFAGLLASLPADERRRLSASSLVSETDADTDATILISTPAVALNIGLGPERLRTVVLDEADALLAGSFKPAARSTYRNCSLPATRPSSAMCGWLACQMMVSSDRPIPKAMPISTPKMSTPSAVARKERPSA